MLKTRLISALILAPLVVLGVFSLSGTGFAAAAACVMLLAAWEWSALASMRDVRARAAYVLATAALLILVWRVAHIEAVVNGMLAAALCWWTLSLFWIARPGMGTGPGAVLFKAVLGQFLIASLWISLVVLHSRPDQGPVWVLFSMLLVWVADSGAYFSGRLLGKRKLAPAVSPGKTWEGVYGALAACTLFALVFATWKGFGTSAVASFVLVCLLAVMFSIVGDLLESLLKRHQGMKDSGSMIPGHGGLLDRLDSMLAAIPIFLLGLRWTQL